MVGSLKKILNEKFHLIGVYIENNIYTYQYIQLSFRDLNLKVEDRFSFNSFDDDKVIKKLKMLYPVLIYIDGDTVVNKKVSKKIGYRNNLIFNANSDDFHFYEYNQDEEVFISVIRKGIVNEIVANLNSKDVFVSDIAFGSFCLTNLLSINKEHQELSSPFSTVFFDNKKIASFKTGKTTTKKYNFEEEVFDEKELPLLASFIGFKFSNSNIEFQNDFLSDNINEFNYKKKFKFAGILALIFLLSTLFISHNLLNYYSNSLSEKKLEYSTIQNTVLKIESLKDEIKTKESILKKSGITNKLFMTKFISEIGNITPNSIEIKQININPPTKKIRIGNNIDFNINEIIIEGSTIDDMAFNDWISELNKLEWTKRIDITEYIEEKNRKNAFNLNIKI